MQLKVMNSPFSEEQADTLNKLLPSLTETQRIWLSGFLAAAPQSSTVSVLSETTTNLQAQESESAQAKPATRVVTILFGSETGNCQSLAEGLKQRLDERGFQVALSSMDDFKTKELKKVEDLLIITATHGEGDPPDNAISFHEFLHGRKAPKLEGVRFAVLALGDLSYEFFCKTGKDFDQRLEELGAERLYPRVDCDIDFDDPAAEWIEGVLKTLGEANQGAAAQTAQDNGQSSTAASAYSRTNPFKAEVLENLNLNGRGSNKETRHLELSIEDSGLSFEPGDSLGIYPENDTPLVDQIISEMDWNPEEPVTVGKQGDTAPLREALLHHFEITVLTKPLLEKAAQYSEANGLHDLLKAGQEEALRTYLDGRDVLDLLRDFAPWTFGESEFVQILRKMPPRLYSIASSYQANPDEVHLTIGTVRYTAHGRDRAGVCSAQIAERTEPGEYINVYVHKNPNFKLPENPDTPIIMVGPGTGVAPFRSFLEEREELEAEGKTWLFFGDQHFRTDFLYQVDWQRWLSEGVLTRMDVAFSRDTEEKVYVQHRMLEKSKEFYEWLQEGAVVYICGDEKHMAKDVHETILSILEQEGGLSREEAEAYLTEMRKQKRYQRDVY
ncbi:assimilatory sulfite reductase (NADPH) flavoprotein subunit [Pullulanibacillus sp. KACC 23026]|uniref:assimilatory sulfite reductase (NADPH) flavoprotein subunit n=1 Tax=Pullulanibacillus sp. KACC 23026 TaxID=3028315 RepID=UPI0023AF006C|nr:assimilatory sulfite reductase (NADPH) flavoprotein subunit [Pullulanibacillus sp. KACC 23026]WEG12918.1 assimilatory sulfite reductase (NADPH) flavoprotein subunit [Pullulanibacillus sp. KACC 23026]